MRHSFFVLLALASSPLAQQTVAVWPVAQGGNGHTYAVFRSGGVLDWNAANAAAIASGGYLCTVTSAAENAFVFSLVDDPAVLVPSFGLYNLGPWIGGIQANGALEPSAGWGWVTGEPLVYSNWVPGQPNNSCGPSEDHMHFFTNSTALRGAQWNDLSLGSCNLPIAYVVEYEVHDCFMGTVGASVGGPVDVFAINGSYGSGTRHVENTVGDSLTLSMALPPGASSAWFALFGALGAANGSATLPTPYGEFCFVGPVLIGGIMHAPWNLQVPVGLAYTWPITLQGMMLVDLPAPTVGTSNAIILEFVPPVAPAIHSVSPSSAVAGQAITVGGTNFNNGASLLLNGAAVTPLSIAAEQITFAYPPSVPCDSVLQVVNVNGQNASSVLNPTPVITNTPSASGPASGGATYTLVGSGFAPGTTVFVGGALMSLTAATESVLVGVTPPGTPGIAAVVVITPGGCVATTTYAYM